MSDVTPSSTPLPIPFPTKAPSIAASVDSKHSHGNKLRRKVKKSGAGHESDGYVSDVGKGMKEKEKEKARKQIEAKAAKEAEKEAKAAAKEAKKEEKVKKSKSKREKKDKSKSPVSGDVTEYETDAGSDGAYLSEAVSLSSISSKKAKASSKSKADGGSDSSKPKKTGSFFRRKPKPTPVVPPMPTAPFPLSVSLPSLSSGPVSGSGSDPAAGSPVVLPPIAARFATTSATPPIILPTPSLPASSVSPNPSNVHPSPGPPVRPNLFTTDASTANPIPATTRESDAVTDEADDAKSVTTSSHSSEGSMPTSLPTSVSTSSHRKPSRHGLFKFGGNTENMKAKPTISLPLTRPFGSATPLSSRGTSPMSGTPFGASPGGFEPPKVMFDIRTQDSSKSTSSRNVSPESSMSSAVVPPTTSAVHFPPLAQGSAGRTPNPAPAPTPKNRPGFLTIQHPHEYSGTHTQDLPLPSPRRINNIPVPPPTPPPTGPLPRVPPLVTNFSIGARGPVSAPPLLVPPPLTASARTPSPLRRGKEAPFPSAKREAVPARLDTLGARMEIPRYRGLYGLGGEVGGGGAGMGRDQQHISAFSADSDEEDDDDYLDPEMLTNEFQQIRRRFYDHDRERASVPITEPDRYQESFSSGGDDSFSYQQLKSKPPSVDSERDEGQDVDEGHRKYSDDRSMYPDEDKSAGHRAMYELEDRDSRHYDDVTRISRYSATQSVYSVMDDEKSGTARERFLSRVAAMYGDGGREVPPMPPMPQIHKVTEEIMIKGTGVGSRRRMVVHD